jgi:hypothetical protein
MKQDKGQIHTCFSLIHKCIQTESRTEFTKGHQEEGMGSSSLVSIALLFGMMKNWRYIAVTVAKHYEFRACGTGVEFRASHLVGKRSTTAATPPACEYA